MIDPTLGERLEPVVLRHRAVRFLRRLALGWGAAALLALLAWAVQRLLGWSFVATLPLVALLGVSAALAMTFRRRRRAADLHDAAQRVEEQFPDLRGLLLTAVEQSPRWDTPLGYLQRRVVQDAISHSRRHDWRGAVPPGSIVGAQLLHLGALVLFLATLWALRPPPGVPRTGLFVPIAGVHVSPGDTQLERGENLVVLARFGDQVPASAELVLGATPATERRIPLTRSLSDPVFGGSVPGLTDDQTYRVEFGGRRTRDFKVTVFEYPRLERADADLTFPEYTGQAARRIEDTRRVTAVEGTQLRLVTHFNKPVASATLVPHDTNQPELKLTLATNAPAAELSAFPLLQKGTYHLRLRDSDGRTNKVPTSFVFEVLPNRTPELKLAAPRGDLRPSALEEIRFEGTVWDDFGVVAHGIAFNLVDQDSQILELGRAVPAGERRGFQHLLRLEELRVEPGQLLSWYVWADDIGPDGQVRRTTGDLFFGEVRPFEEIFREGDSAQSEQQSNEMGSEGGNQTAELLRLQKQIVSATWKVRREARGVTSRYQEDVRVIHESQQQALDRAEDLAGQANSPRLEPLWNTVLESMGAAVVRLGEAEKDPSALAGALAAESAAYQALLKLQAREFEVTRSRNRGRGQGGEAGNQRQMDELELTQAENRYETQRQAQAPTTPERREQLQVLNRLQELARRQQEVNERLKELQAALQAARTEEQRAELRRQLKRLQEEQQQMLADLDELDQRTQRPENQSRMSELRQRLEETRTDMQRANQAANEGSVEQAVAAGTRAERQLQAMRDDLRRQNSSEFAEDLRSMRSDARELERRQEQLARDLAARENPARPTLGQTDPGTNLLARLSEQRQRLTNLVERATELSQAAEASEPLVSQHLYDSLRELNQLEARHTQQLQEDLLERGRLTRGLYDRLRSLPPDDEARSLELTAEMLRQGYGAEAGETAQRSVASLESLRRGVERAAERVLGDDTAALRLARDELDVLADQLAREIASAAGTNDAASTQLAQAQAQARNQAGERGAPGDEDSSTRQPGQRSRDATDPNANPNAPGTSPSDRETNQAQAQAQAQGQGQSQGQGQGDRETQGQARNPGEGQAQAQAQGQGQGQGQPGAQPGRARGNQDGSRQGAQASGRGGRGGTGGLDLDSLLGGTEGTDGGGSGTGPITTEGFAPWSDRLREVEELIDLPGLRDEVATARERARLTRVEWKRQLKKPDWATVKLEILKPLVEVRNQLDDELARRGSENPLLPIDRDPVPNRYSELVRRYYEELGRDR